MGIRRGRLAIDAVVGVVHDPVGEDMITDPGSDRLLFLYLGHVEAGCCLVGEG
jgi:hypothetical protein